jgi:signal transduction histidine kinase
MKSLSDTPDAIARDVSAVGRIEAVPTLLQVLCDCTGMRFAAVARVTDHTWTACAVEDRIEFGLKAGGQLVLDTTLCTEVRRSGRAILIEQVSASPVYRDHHTPRIYGLESYVSVPIELPSGEYFGNLCAIDPAPAPALTAPHILSMFNRFAALIALQLENVRAKELVDAALLDERAAGELREQFIAVLGHDLRTPLAAVSAGADVLQQTMTDPLALTVAASTKRSVKRMSDLIDDVLDFARGRLGSGIGVKRSLTSDLAEALQGVVAEVRAIHPHKIVSFDVDVRVPVLCDRARIQQLASNLLANAVAHGRPDSPVRFTATTQDGELVLEVWNDGDPIPADSLPKIFGPFWRRAISVEREGLGLGLFICAQIVKSHYGQLDVQSSRQKGTLFTARLPLN